MINWLKKVGIRDLTLLKEKKFLLIAGPNIIETPELTEQLAKKLVEITDKLKVPFIFKASYPKADQYNEGQELSFKTGLAILDHIRKTYNIPIMSDVHCLEEVKKAKSVLDFIGIPGHMSRQSNFLIEAARTNKVINIKKGQFLSPEDMKITIEKIRSTGNTKSLITERGTFFGYNKLVNDFSGIQTMKQYAPVIYDASHSTLSKNRHSEKYLIPYLARAAVAAGAVGLYIDVHTDSDKKSYKNSFPLSKVDLILKDLLEIHHLVNSLHKWDEVL